MIDKFRAVALEIAQKAGPIIRSNFTLGMAKEWKNDYSPVTATDIAINELVIERLKSQFPEHGVMGEEISAYNEMDEHIWVCDPVDGTLLFAHGVPIFTFSLALTQNGKPILGVILDPMGDQLFYGEKGGQATRNGSPIRVSNRASLPGSPINIEGSTYDIWGLFPALRGLGARPTSFYSILYSAGLVALGEFPGIVLGSTNPWDAAATKVIVEAAGGRVTDLFGNDQRYDRPTKGLIATNGHIHDQLLATIQTVLANMTLPT